ncbi:hypothetical protein DXG01_013723 [Tephrocybe rancida]|nr:hypothetical protein DXG01_013723 [Tephrocybe rancida]
MYQTQPILEAHEVDSRTISIGSIPSLPIIITASVVLFAVDATITLLRRNKREPGAIAIKEELAAAPSSQPHRSLRRFADKSRSILADVQTLEKQLSINKSRRTRRSTLKRKRLDRRLPSFELKGSNTPRPEPSCEFSAFCERLVLTNKIWKQEQELKDLRATAAAKARIEKDSAFSTFCDQLLLWNRIWKLEREVADVVQEKERIQRERVAAVTRAAKRMVQDVQKERMVEEFVKDLIGEMGTTKAELGNLQAQHEREVEEIHGEWVKDYRKVTHELAQLKLAQSARLAEQEVSNSMEDSLFESMQEGRRRIESLEENLKFAGYGSSDEMTLNDAEASDAESELLSELSTSSTCVSSRGSLRRSSLTVFNRVIARKRCTSQGSLTTSSRKLQHARSLSMPTVDDACGVGPQELDHAKSTSATRRNATRTYNHSGRPLAVRNRTTSVMVASRPPPTSPFGATFVKSGGVTNRAPWRV